MRFWILLAALQGCWVRSVKNFRRYHLPWQSESKQDVTLVENLFRNREMGFFVELGAADGKYLSNTYALEHGMNWTGILIEPLTEEVEKCPAHRPSSTCVQACVSQTPGVQDFFEDTRERVQSGLVRLNMDSVQQKSSILAMRQVHCQTLPKILKQHAAPQVIDWLSLDVERAELEVLETLFEDGYFHFDVISMEAQTPEESLDRYGFMRERNYQFMDRIGDDVYVYGWTFEESVCDRKDWQRLRQKLVSWVRRGQQAKNHMDLVRQLRETPPAPVNESMVARYVAFASKAIRSKCKAASLNALMHVALSVDQEEFEQRICQGHAYMEYAMMKRMINPLTYDDCSPLYALPLGRMDFLHVLRSRWPTFFQLQLISERLSNSHRAQGYPNICQLDADGFPNPSNAFHLYPEDLHSQIRMCGGLRLVLNCLDRAIGATDENLEYWRANIQAAERVLKMLGYKMGLTALLGVIGALPAERSPFVPLPDESSRDEEARPSDPVETPRAFDARSATSADRDPWARTDPWSGNRYPRNHDYQNEDEFLQFVEWRAARDRGAPWTTNHGGWNGPWYGNGQMWHAARDEQERTTAGPPPEWDGVDVEFKDYKLKAKIWLRTTRTPAHARGPLLLKNLSKGPWEDLKFLASDEGWLSDPNNGNRLIELMDSREFYGEEKRESMLAACSRLTFHLKRQRGESARSFMTRWDTAERKVREHEVKLPQEFLGFLMVNALQLDSEKTKLLLNYTKGALSVTDVKEWLRIHETDLDVSHLGTEKKKSGTSTNYMLDFDTASEIQLMDASEYAETESTEPTEVLMAALADLDDEESAEPEVTLTESETKEILMTMIKDGKGKGRSYAGAMKAKKNRDLARGFGAGRDGVLRPGTYEVSISELKKRTKCNKCGQLGHWARECPSKGKRPPGSQSGCSESSRGSGKSKEVNYLTQDSIPESEFFFLTSEPIEEGNEGEESYDFPDDCSQPSRDYMQRPQPHPCFHMDTCTELACATIDTGCQRMASATRVLQAWARMVLRSLWIIARAIGHRVTMYLNMVGPQGVLARQMIESAELLDAKQLDVVVARLGQRLQEQSVQESKQRTPSPTPSSWSKVTSQVTYQPSVPPPQTPKSKTPTSMPATPDYHMASMWDVPVGINLQKDSPKCYCRKNAQLFVSKTEKNPNRLFWRCPNSRPRQCSFFRWLAQETLRPELLPPDTPASTVEWLMKRQQEVCQHTLTTRAGSNAFYRQIRCMDCGLLLGKEATGYQQQKAESEKKSEAGSRPGDRKMVDANMEKEYEEFLAWRNRQVLQNDIKMDQHWLLAGEDLTSISGCQDIYALRFGEEEGEPSEPVNQYKERSFPGTHHLSLEALVRRAHEGLGHPGRDRFLRILTNSKASKKVLEIAKNLQCSEIGLNEVIGVDTIQLRAPFSKKTKYCLNIVDYSSHFQLVVPLSDHTAHGARAGYRMWLKIFGPPRKLLCDLGKEFRKEFETLAESDGTEVLPSSLETPEQRGLVERQGQLYKEMFAKTLEQTQCGDWDQWHQTIDLVCCTKNRLLSRGGYSPAQRVFGYQHRIPGGLMSEGEDDQAVQSLAAIGDLTVTRAMDIRRAAAIAVVATQLPSTVWLSYNHHLVKAAPEKIRPAAEEEFASLSGWLEGISNAKKQFETSKIQGMIDLAEDPAPPMDSEEEKDYWRKEDSFWVRVHLQPRTKLFRPDLESDLPFDLDTIQTIRRTLIRLPGGDLNEIEDQWTTGADRLPHGEEWTGETWFTERQELLEDDRPAQRPHLPPPEFREMDNEDYTPSIAPLSPPPPEDMEIVSQEEEEPDRKRELEVESQAGSWEGLPATKRMRLDLLEVYHTELINKSAQRQKKGKEARFKDFTGRDAERLQRAIHKEFNNNVGTGAYELLSPGESARIRKDKPEKIMKSRYVLTKKPIEDFALEDARSSDEILDSSPPEIPSKAKCRHVMQGYSETDLLDLETSTPQVHRDSVIFAAQLMATMHWTPGFADFTQAFHSGDPIDRELYAEQPSEGLPGAARGQILRLKKTCYGLTDGPYAWYKHIVKYITEVLGYRQSIVDSCLFYLDSEEDSSGQSRIDGVIALATDDLFSRRHATAHGKDGVDPAELQAGKIHLETR
eukprot:symbB.v1.2.022535.t1/scaffold2006.1/size92704/3